MEPKVESNSGFSCLSIWRIGIQGVFSVMQLGISSKKNLHKPSAGFFSCLEGDWLSSYSTWEHGSWESWNKIAPGHKLMHCKVRVMGMFNLLSYPSSLSHSIWMGLQVLNACTLRTLPEDLTTPRDLEPVPLWEELLLLSLQIYSRVWSHLKRTLKYQHKSPLTCKQGGGFLIRERCWGGAIPHIHKRKC